MKEYLIKVTTQDEIFTSNIPEKDLPVIKNFDFSKSLSIEPMDNSPIFLIAPNTVKSITITPITSYSPIAANLESLANPNDFNEETCKMLKEAARIVRGR